MNLSILNNFHEFHFLRPYWLLAAPLLVWLAWHASVVLAGNAGGWRHLVDTALQPYVLRAPEAKPSHAARGLAVIAALLATLALAGPAWERLPQPVMTRSDARVIVLALTPSMLAGDVAPSRIERVRYKLRDLLAREGDRPHALIAYAGDAHVVAPLTRDVATIDLLLTALAPDIMPVAGNDPVAAIKLAVGAIQRGAAGHGEILLVTDTLGDAAPTRIAAGLPAGISLSVLGVGSDAGAPVPAGNGEFMRTDNGGLLLAKLDRAGLAQLASAGHGKFSAMSDDDGDLDALVSTTVGDWQKQDDGSRFDQWADRGQWLVWALLPLALAGFRRGWLAVIFFAVFLPTLPSNAQAAGFTDKIVDAFRNDDQRGIALLENGEAEQAAKTFIDPAWRARALYKAGKYDEAAKAWQSLPGADAAYNRGNALAFMQDFDNALAAYDAALKIQPDHADAKFNRALVEKLRREQKEQQQKDQQDKKNQKQDSKQDQGKQGQQDQGKQGDAKQGSSGQQNQQQGQQQGQNQPGQQQPGQQNSQASGAGKTPAPQKPDEKKSAAQQQKAQQDNATAQAAQAKSGDKKDGEGAAAAQQTDKAAQMTRDAWLEQIPDDPGAWLRRKFWQQSHPNEGETR